MLKMLVSGNCNLFNSGQFVLFESLLYVLYDSTLLFFFFFFFLFFFFFFFFLCCLIMFIRFQLYLPFVLIFSFFFLFSTNFSHGYFSTFHLDLCFFNRIKFSFTWALSLQFSSYFVINNVMPYDFVFTLKTLTIVPN